MVDGDAECRVKGGCSGCSNCDGGMKKGGCGGWVVDVKELVGIEDGGEERDSTKR